MGPLRNVARVVPSRPVVDGADITVRRSLGGKSARVFDPFLLVDELKPDQPGALDAGFAAHPHRGLETVTFVVEGQYLVRDSYGQQQVIGPGGVHWTHAASGVVHSETPLPGSGLRAVQIWLNLARGEKMGDPAVACLTPAHASEVRPSGGGVLRVYAGEMLGATGPISGGATRPLLADCELMRGGGLSVDLPANKAVMAYVLEGKGLFGITSASTGELVGRGHLVVFSPGETLKILAGQQGVRFLLMAALPLSEPVCRYGPIVMTSPAEVDQAVEQFHRGTFCRQAPSVEG